MTQKHKTLIMSTVGAILVIALLVLMVHPQHKPSTRQYFQNQGNIFGTYYNIRYEASEDLHEAVLERMQAFDGSLSTFNPNSVISKLNQGVDTVWDADFTKMYATAEEVSALTEGAFDIRVAPLVNAWGFGFKNKEQITPALIDSLLHVRNILDASAIAKGQACDVVADLLRSRGVENLLVDIGGEVVLQGLNPTGHPWRVGITKPVDDPTGQQNEIQEVIESTHLCMATSGNYRQFYYEGGLRRSHTIDPRTGYPAESDLLSATIVSTSCMRADALATACMVLGSTRALALINSLDSTECYLITSTPADTMQILTSAHFPL